MKMNKNSNQGFTLIELMITVAIIGILATLVYPSYVEQVKKAKRSDGYDALLRCAAEQARFYTTNTPPSYFNETRAETDSACGWDGTKFTSQEGNYTLGITNNNCTTGNSTWCFSITATATAAQLADTSCASFTIDHRGVKTALDKNGADSTSVCWK